MATTALPTLPAVGRGTRRRSPFRSFIPAYVMCAPTVVLFLVFMVFPIVFVVYSSFLDWNGITSIFDARWIGLENYGRLLRDETWWLAVKNTVLYALVKLGFELPLALVIALALNTGLRGRSFFRAVGFLPVVTSVAVVSLAFTFFFAPLGGPFNALLMDQLGLIDTPIAFLGDRAYAFWTVTGVAVWHDLGINMVFFLAALQTVGRDLYEAATVDGANAWQKFRAITVPSIRPITTVIVMLSLAGSLKVFDHFAVMTGGGPGFSTTTMVLYMFRYTSFGGRGLSGSGQTVPAVGYGSAVAIGLGLVILAAVLLQQAIVRWQAARGKAVAIASRPLLLQSDAESRRRARRLRLVGHGWDGVRYALLALYALLCLYPFVWMAATSLRTSASVFSSGLSLRVSDPQWANYREIWEAANLPRAAMNTVLITAVCMALIILTTSMTAYAVTRSNFPGRSFIMVALLTTFLVPGEMLIIPTFYVNRSLHLIGDWKSLIAVIVVMTAGAQVFNIYLLMGHFQTLPSEIYDAAAIDGASFFGTYRQIAMPLVRPALATIALLTFMGIWNAYLLPLVYLSQQRNFQTLTIALIQYSKQFQTLYHVMAAGAVITLVPVMLVFLFLQRYFIRGLTEGATKG